MTGDERMAEMFDECPDLLEPVAPFRLLVCGSRDFSDEAHLEFILDLIHRKYPHMVVVEGAAPGADTLSAKWATSHGVPVEPYPADWTRYGRRAGYVRNVQMADSKPDAVIAFYRDPDQPSRGTQMMVRLAAERGIPTWVPPLPAYQF